MRVPPFLRTGLCLAAIALAAGPALAAPEDAGDARAGGAEPSADAAARDAASRGAPWVYLAAASGLVVGGVLAYQRRKREAARR